MKCRYENCSDHTNKKNCLWRSLLPAGHKQSNLYQGIPPILADHHFPQLSFADWATSMVSPMGPRFGPVKSQLSMKGGVPIPRCNPWCWNIYPYLPQKLPSYVGKYSIYGAYGLGISWFYCNYLLMLNAGNFREWSISSLSIIIPATPSNPSIPLRKNAPTQRFRPTQCVVPGDSHILVGKISIPNVFGTCPIHQVLINTIRYYPNDSPGKCGRTF